jgi:LysR family transcriptional regulator for bpeEF and oprC
MDLLKSMAVFHEVCSRMSFSQAAKELNLAPSAVSRQVSELERFLGVRLLERTTRSIGLTDEGRRYLRKMDSIIQEVQVLKAMSGESGRVEGHIRLTAPPVLGPMYLQAALGSFLCQYPGVSVSAVFVNRESNLIEEGYDLAVRIGVPVDSNLVAREIGRFPLGVVASPGYIKAHGKPRHPRDLARHNCLINTLTQAPRRWRFRDGRRVFSIKVDGRCDVNDDSMLQALARAGQGVAYLPAWPLQDDLNKRKLVPLLEEYLLEALPISIVYPSRQLLGTAKRRLIDHLLEYAQQQPLADTK